MALTISVLVEQLLLVKLTTKLHAHVLLEAFNVLLLQIAQPALLLLQTLAAR